MPSNFQKVAEFHDCFGLAQSKEPNHDVFQDSSLVRLRYSLIHEEVHEFLEAVEARDCVEIVDALCDILYVVYGTGVSFGVNLDRMISSMFSDTPPSSSNFFKVRQTQTATPVLRSLQDLDWDDHESVGLLGVRTLRMCLEKVKNSFAEKSFTSTAEALTCMLVECYSTGSRVGVDMDAAFSVVHNSNMSKLCRSREEAESTVQCYSNQKDSPYDSPAYKISNNGEYYIVYNKSTGKILKSMYYTPAKLQPFTSNQV